MKNNLEDRIWEKLEKKMAIEKFCDEEKIKERGKVKMGNKSLAKVASFSILALFLAGNIYTYATENKNIFTWAFDRIGISQNYEENKISVNKSEVSNDYTLTLEDYGIDAETLLLSFDLKTADEIELEYPFIEEPTYYFYDMVKIINENNDEYVLSNEIINGTDNEKSTILLDKINNKEYKIYEIYTIDSSKITENSKLYIDFYLENLPEDAIELVYDRLCEFNLETPINSEKIDNSFKEYSINNMIAAWDSYEFPDGEIGQTTIRISKIKNSNILTKLTLDLGGYYHTGDNQYTLKITDENNNTILNRDIEYILPGVEQDIIIPKMDMNSKINITFFEEDYVYNEKTKNYTKTDIGSATITLDLTEIAK